MHLETVNKTVARVATELKQGGAGPPLLYLHAGDGIASADPLLEKLADHFSVYAPSHPGFDGSFLPKAIHSVDDLAYYYLDLMDELNLDPVMLMGSSFGAWIACEIAVRNTSRIKSLVLTAPVGVKFCGPHERSIADLFSKTDAELAECLFAEPKPAPDFASMAPESVMRYVRNREAFTLFGWSPTLFNPKLAQRLHRINIPSLLLWGAADRVLAKDYRAGFERALPAARSETVEGAGHYLHVDQPYSVASLVVGFGGGAAG